MKKLLLGLLLLCSNAFGQADYLSPNGMTEIMSGVDDGTAHIPLGHAFPYFGGTFTDAWMSSNGFILLYDPVSQYGNSQTWNQGCCSGFNPTGNQGFSFMIAPLWTDLIDANATPDAGYYYETNSDESKFLWYNINEYGTQNTNTFQVNLWPDGSFDFIYDEVDITHHNTWIGFTGDTLKSAEVNELKYAQGSIDEFGLDFVSTTFQGGRAWYGNDGGYAATGPDCSDSLNDPSCPGYEEAYYSQQCNNDPFYDNQCPGYEQAYFDQQCSYDDLYDQMCPGYDNAIIVQNASGTDFIFGDDISDFYDTEPMIDETDMFLSTGNETDMFLSDQEATDMFTDDTGMYEEPTEQFVEAMTINEPFETFTDNFTEELYNEPITEPIEELIAEEIFEEEPLPEEVFEEEYVQESEEITHQEDDMYTNEENLLISEELPVDDVLQADNIVADRVAGPSINAVAIALNTVALAESNAVSVSKTQSSQSTSSGTTSTEATANQSNMSFYGNSASSFDSVDSAFADATFEMMVDPTITVSSVEVVAVESPTEQATQEEEQAVDFQMESSTPQQGGGFAEQQNQSFSTGQSITAVLNNVQPNFSKFDVAPPSQQEQQTENKAEAQASNMSDAQLEENLEEFTDQLQDSGGFGDQSMTIFLMGRVNGFANYGGTLQDNPFYTDRGMAGGRVQNDRNAMLRMMGTDNKHEELVSLQYK